MNYAEKMHCYLVNCCNVVTNLVKSKIKIMNIIIKFLLCEYYNQVLIMYNVLQSKLKSSLEVFCIPAN